MPATRCSYCGIENAPGVDVCSGCGRRLVASETVSPHSTAGAQPDARSTVLGTFANPLDAQVAAKHLEDSGIPVVVNSDDCGGLLPQLSIVGGYRLLVAEMDLPRASEALREMEEQFGLKARVSVRHGGLPPPLPKSSGSTPYLLMIGLFVAGAMIGGVLGHYGQKLKRSNSVVDSEDFNKDGRADAWWTYENGRCVAFSIDRNFDGKVDSWTTYEGENSSSSQDDDNFDGKPDLWYSLSNGVMTSARFDADFDGKPDAETRFEFGRRVEQRYTASNKLGYWKRDFFTNGVLRESVIDRDRDGVLDERVLYDPFGVVLRVEPLK